jgi:putative transposase
MPDHLHMIVEVRSVGLIELMRRLKSHSTAIYRAKTGKSPLWQQSFHDHGLREPQDFESAVEYILFNPVRAELADAWEDYPLLAGDYLTANYPPA